MSQTEIEKGFQLINESVGILQQTLDASFFDAYIENQENFLDGRQARVIDNVPTKEEVAKLEANYQQLSDLSLTAEEKRKITQLVLLQGLMKDNVQANHQLTPDGLGFLFVYMFEQLTTGKKNVSVLDPVVGTGNLLYTIMANLNLAGYQTTGFGVDVDDTLLSISSVNRDWLGLDVELTHQDSLHPLLIDPVDFAVADLPIGFYPDDDRAKEFQTSHKDGHSYAHHLLMEKAMTHVKPNGFGLFLLPTNFLESEQAAELKTWLLKEVYLQAVLQLPNSLFKHKSMSKSIIVVQNPGESAQQAKEVLLAELPSLKDSQAVVAFVKQFRSWREKNIIL
ncbi:SAM-dependent methyltransferase [Vagococcus penaei]|uniref:SAM-dependent methyltransferase n=1 Tax=Vagococcus penaei TaxID=633807 RepID=A0A1Q2D5T2_9ENTE|nr:class I SAM-dependent methyltransferase [Vagococcus penaei]AQP53683.1 SAM-dependent methyltransferase [Vagococcus penaei]RST97697.1 SAM-dependent methyltransferase [Vagococcus penaei]